MRAYLPFALLAGACLTTSGKREAQTCADDAECFFAGEACQDGACRPVACNDSSPCADRATECRDFRCVYPCVTDRDCLSDVSGRVCSTRRGYCVEGSSADVSEDDLDPLGPSAGDNAGGTPPDPGSGWL